MNAAKFKAIKSYVTEAIGTPAQFVGTRSLDMLLDKNLLESLDYHSDASVRASFMTYLRRDGYVALFRCGVRWPLLEPEFLKSPNSACWYAIHAIKGRWLDAEPVILKEDWPAYQYANEAIRGRWRKAETIIVCNKETAVRYAIHVIKGDWPACTLRWDHIDRRYDNAQYTKGYCVLE
jgi:hypothetical protein